MVSFILMQIGNEPQINTDEGAMREMSFLYAGLVGEGGEQSRLLDIEAGCGKTQFLNR